MTSGKKAIIGGTLVLLLAVVGEVAWLHHERNDAGSAAPPPLVKVNSDELVFLKKERPSSLADVKQLIGTTLWISAGGQLEYYPYAAHHADYSKSVGTLLGAEPLVIKDAFEQVAPKSATFRIAGGDKQVLLAFTMPKSTDPAKLYAVPVGYKQAGDYTFSNDDIFFYDDPHQLYSQWGTDVWQAIDAHKVILGMSEREVNLSLGQVSKSTSQDFGNRMVIFQNLDKPMAVTFEKGHVTAFRPDQGF
ncbi:MAG: hypothetical protein P4K80_07860 [Acidobacteriaceae bacterium]|nr:hypothetical protein [Acidobacteriaceae bacterium]